MMKEQVLARIENRTATVGIIGLGYVGLPLAVEFARAGFTVIGFDVSQRVCDLLNSGASHIQDVPAAEVAAFVKSGHFRATTDANELKPADALSIAVPTPLGKTHDPDMSYVQAAAATVAHVAHPGLLVVLESTTYPGTTREVVMPLLTGAGYTVGTDIFIAFSPERVDPGNPVYNTRNTPKVVGGITPACTELATALYSSCIETIVPVSSTEVAELVKLLENTFRSVNIAMANEMAIVCDKLGVDVWEVIDAAATKPFGFMKFTPGPGIGGHCIPLDPHYLAWKMRTLNYRTRFIELAGEVNTAMPAFVVEKVSQALNSVRKPLNGSSVLILGVAYKRDIDDVRESPALDVIRLLEAQGAVVSFHDPYVASIRDDDGHGGDSHEPPRIRKSVELSPAALESYDVVVIVTDHRSVDYQEIVDHAAVVVDTRNATAATKKGKATVVSLSSSRTTSLA
ncbi:MAG: UDP-N-acetyl-D-glucosamine dehydrogenase [Gemmatimonadetes bacterium]|nr:UDP-N-acetyl-D-glucosamine dehydrogenase [Gemmatimonadota bacterium]